MSDKRKEMRERVDQLNYLLNRPEIRKGVISVGTLRLHASGMSDSTPSLPLWSVRMYIDKAGNSRPLDWLDDVTHGELMERTAALMDQPSILQEKASLEVPEPTKLYPLTDRQHATVVAALRHYEHHRIHETEYTPDWLFEIATNSGTIEALDGDEIAALLDKLNEEGV